MSTSRMPRRTAAQRIARRIERAETETQRRITVQLAWQRERARVFRYLTADPPAINGHTPLSPFRIR